MKKPPSISRVASKFADPRSVSKAVEAKKARQHTQAAYEAPATPTEEILSAIWSKLLVIDKVGRNDNFFALGGHSLMAVQVIARVRQSLGIELPLRAMFDAPSIAQFAERIEGARAARTGVDSPPMTRVPRTGDSPPSFAQQRLWFIDQLEPGGVMYNLASMYRMRGPLNVPALEKTINEIVRRHESLRTTFANVDGQPVSVIAPELQTHTADETRRSSGRARTRCRGTKACAGTSHPALRLGERTIVSLFTATDGRAGPCPDRRRSPYRRRRLVWERDCG